MTKDILQSLIDQGEQVLTTYYVVPNTFGFPELNAEKYAGWRSQVLNYIQSNLDNDSHYVEAFKEALEVRAYNTNAKRGIGLLKSLINDIDLGLITPKENVDLSTPLDKMINILERFHIVARQLRNRYDKRPTLNVTDEYDVQDLLHALLKVNFDDVRTEEWCPSYAGKCSRMDFLLKDFKTVVEVKKTRIGLGGREIGTQLIEDIARYQHHPDCDVLVCFVYDPEGLIGNPKGLENDLNRLTDNIQVKVFIRP